MDKLQGMPDIACLMALMAGGAGPLSIDEFETHAEVSLVES